MDSKKEVHHRLEMIWNPDFPTRTEKPIFPKFEPNLFENRNSSAQKMGFFWNKARKIKQAGNQLLVGGVNLINYYFYLLSQF